jgi:hypothetical protein
MFSDAKKLGNSKKVKQTSLITADASPEVATTTSVAITNTTDLMPFALTSAAVESAQVNQAAVFTATQELSAPVSALENNDLFHTAHELQVSASSSAFGDTNTRTDHELQVSVAPVAYSEVSLSSPDTMMRANFRRTESEQNPCTQHSGPGLFSNAQNVFVAGGTFNYTVNMAPANTGHQGQVKIPVFQKPNPSPIFTGRKDVLHKLEKIFVPRTNSQLMTRRSCLLWGLGGIGKTQICLKFTEDRSDE